MALLEVRDLSVAFPGGSGRGSSSSRAVDGVSFDVEAGRVAGLVGESGSGKSVTSMAVMGLLPKNAQVSGRAAFDGRDLLSLPERELEGVRGRDVAMVFQDPMTSLNPVVTVGTQITEVLRRHTGASRRAARDEAGELLARVGIPAPVRRLREYPHQLSGGMRQRAMIAIALACNPKLLIADEPTTALDVTIQAQVLELMGDLVRERGTAMLLITHDLGVVAGLCDTVTVMYSGRVVERAGRHELFARPRHRYTSGLLASVPRLDAPRGQRLTPIPGTPRDVIGWTDGCAFAPRCTAASDACRGSDLPLEQDDDAPAGAGQHLLRCAHPVPAPHDHEQHDQQQERSA
ncbi:MAG: ABC transporter ATP-binding protein [Quadrisphaera sp.]